MDLTVARDVTQDTMVHGPKTTPNVSRKRLRLREDQALHSNQPRGRLCTVQCDWEVPRRLRGSG